MEQENNKEKEPISLGELRYRIRMRREAMLAKIEAKKKSLKDKLNQRKEQIHEKM